MDYVTLTISIFLIQFMEWVTLCNLQNKRFSFYHQQQPHEPSYTGYLPILSCFKHVVDELIINN